MLGRGNASRCVALLQACAAATLLLPLHLCLLGFATADAGYAAGMPYAKKNPAQLSDSRARAVHCRRGLGAQVRVFRVGQESAHPMQKKLEALVTRRGRTVLHTAEGSGAFVPVFVGFDT